MSADSQDGSVEHPHEGKIRVLLHRAVRVGHIRPLAGSPWRAEPRATRTGEARVMANFGLNRRCRRVPWAALTGLLLVLGVARPGVTHAQAHAVGPTPIRFEPTLAFSGARMAAHLVVPTLRVSTLATMGGPARAADAPVPDLPRTHPRLIAARALLASSAVLFIGTVLVASATSCSERINDSVTPGMVTLPLSAASLLSGLGLYFSVPLGVRREQRVSRRARRLTIAATSVVATMAVGGELFHEFACSQH